MPFKSQAKIIIYLEETDQVKFKKHSQKIDRSMSEIAREQVLNYLKTV